MQASAAPLAQAAEPIPNSSCLDCHSDQTLTMTKANPDIAAIFAANDGMALAAEAGCGVQSLGKRGGGR